MTDRQPGISEDEAVTLWRRAAEMHAASDRSGSSQAPVESDRHQMLSVHEVVEAAEGAGIHPDYVRLALAERALPDAHSIHRDRWQARWLRRVAPGIADSIELTRFIGASPGRVLDGLQVTVDRPDSGLRLENSLGEDPVKDGVLVYRAVGSGVHFGQALDMADVRVLLVTIRPEGSGTRLGLRVPLFRRGVNLGLTGISAGLVGSAGSWSGFAAGGLVAGALGVVSMAALAVPAVVGAVAGGAAGMAGYRSLVNGLVRGAEASLNRWLLAVEAESLRSARSLEATSGGGPG